MAATPRRPRSAHRSSCASRSSDPWIPLLPARAPMPVPAIEFREVCFARPGRPRILDRFSRVVEAGDVLALVGRSGAGKTTLLKLVNRLLLPDEGAILVEGRDTRDWEPIRLRRRVGYVLQEVGLFPHLAVAANVTVVPRLERWADDRLRQRLHAL